MYYGVGLIRYVFQGVHMLLTMGSSAEGMGRPWAPDEKRTNKLIFIGRNLDRKALTESFEACIEVEE
jgi:G3E family GTPase